MEPYLAELRIFAFGIIPRDWAPCNGQLLQIQTNQALFSVIGTQYGGDGVRTFALPNLQGRAPMHGKGTGQASGANRSSLTVDNLAPHGHALNVSSAKIDVSTATNNFIGAGSDFQFATGKNVGAAMTEGSLGKTGGNAPISNMQPYLGMSICIALRGIFPPRS